MSSDESLKILLYKDVLQPSMRRIGKSLELGTNLCADKFDEVVKRLKKDIPEDKQAVPEPIILLPTLQGIALTNDDTPKNEMFYNGS